MNTRPLLDAVDGLLGKNQLRQAETMLKDLLRVDPKNVQALQRLAAVAKGKGDYTAASVILRRAQKHADAQAVRIVRFSSFLEKDDPTGPALRQGLAAAGLRVDESPEPTPGADVFYAALGPGRMDAAMRFLRDAPKGAPVILDMARLSQNLGQEARRGLHQALAARLPWVVARRQSQLLDHQGNPYAGPALVCPDYLSYGPLSPAVRADISWFVLRALGRVTCEKRPTEYVEALLEAPLGDPALEDAARRLLALAPDFAPALAYLRARDLCRGEAIPKGEFAIYMRDSLGGRSLLSLARGETVRPLAEYIATLRRHLFPRGIRGDRRKRVLLSVGRKQRDLFITLFIRYWLEKMGYEVFVRPSQNAFRAGIVELLPDAVVWGERTTPSKMSLGRFARERGLVSIVRREEAGHTYSSWQSADPKRRSWSIGQADYSDIVDAEIFSGPEAADLTATHGHMPRQAVHDVGAMLFDIYLNGALAPHLPPREDFRARHGLDPGKKNMVFCARWAHADRDPKNAIPESTFQTKGQAVDERVVAYIAMCQKGRRVWLEALDRLYRERGDRWNFIFRPHPGELMEPYVTHFQAKGMHVPVILDDFMPIMLNHMDLVIHAASTTALEAHFLGIPAINFADPEPAYLPVSRLSPRCDDYESLVQCIDSVEPGRSNADTTVLAEIQRSHYGAMDGQACRRAAEVIHGVIEKSGTSPCRLPKDTVRPYTEERGRDAIKGDVTIEEVERYYALVKRLLDSGAA
ncbi:hypothetical protein [Desulfolutivibrio sulfoxidireducens]|uniref:hypothetical protein n=1 Tax=Desulfolutivibrio sulfoxidireducens TaxID=2773299 RepID=UPI00159E465E|nr:hypothetical protein [Desulfolutivibrio sulfoxidireducens]QLA17053.1 hypothetical protein GD605_13610 [Desulfolutivibrio sulfoxidireducens]